MNYVDILKTEDNFFKVIPQNIGEINSCRTSNPKGEKDTPEKRRKQYALGIGLPLVIGAILIAIAHASIVFIVIVIAVALFVIFKCVSNIRKFEGTDYFVGTEGYTILSFQDDRSNTKIEDELHFDKCADFISKEVETKQNGNYIGTEVKKIFYSCVDKDGKRSVLGGWEGKFDKSNEDYQFMKDMESSWSKYYFNKLKNKYLAGEGVSFNVYTDDGYINDYFVFKDGTLKVGDRIYDKETLKDVRMGNGVLIIEHVNHSTKLFGLIKKGNQEEIPFSMIANSKVFMLFFEDFYARVKG